MLQWRPHRSGLIIRLRSKRGGVQRALVALATMALALASFAHTTVAAPSTQQTFGVPDVVAANPDLYRLPDGTLPIFCISADGDDHSASGECEFCRLLDNAGLTASAAQLGHPGSHGSENWPDQLFHSRSKPHGQSARGPPAQV